MNQWASCFWPRAIVVSALLTGACLASAAITLDPAVRKDLSARTTQLYQKVSQAEEIRAQFHEKSSERQALTIKLKSLESERDDARAKQEQIEKVEREYPGTIPDEVLKQRREANRSAAKNLEDAQKRVKALNQEIVDLQSMAERQDAEILRLQDALARGVSRVVDGALKQRLDAMKIPRPVSATARIACGNDTLAVCEAHAKLEAERLAAEQGATTLVNSLTEVQNAKLTRDVIRSEVSATLSDVAFPRLEPSLVGKTLWYEATITAKLTPGISEALRKQMEDESSDEVYALIGGRVDYAPSKINPAVNESPPETTYAPPLQDGAAWRLDAKKEEPLQPSKPMVTPTPRKREKPISTF